MEQNKASCVQPCTHPKIPAGMQHAKAAQRRIAILSTQHTAACYPTCGSDLTGRVESLLYDLTARLYVPWLIGSNE
eukprot:scaffold390677_cov21-Prasinocladus_malaysianus.AAC.1